MFTNLSFYDVDIDGGQLLDLVLSCPLLDTLTLYIYLSLCIYLDLVIPNLRVFSCEGCFLAPLCFKFTPRLGKMTVSFALVCLMDTKIQMFLKIWLCLLELYPWLNI